jgi:hypothetical protein
MTRIPFSVRLPVGLAEALDHIAECRGESRSDLIDVVLCSLEREDRDTILKTEVTAPTERRNLRLSAEALQQLKQLAGDLEPSDFLRRTLTCLVRMDPHQGAHRPTTSGSAKPSSSAPRRDEARPSAFADDRSRGDAVGITIMVVLLIGAFVSFIVWLICRPASSEPGADPRGQLPSGTSEESPA